MSSLIGQLKVLLSLDSAAFETGAKRAQAQLHATGSKAEIMGDKVGRMGKALVVAGAALAGSALVGQLASLVRKGLDHASALGEQAQQLGVSTKALQEYRYAATQVGLSQDEMDAALAKLTRSMGEGAQGAKTQAEAFAKLGIDIKAFVASGGEAGDLLPKIAQGLQGIASPADRAAILVDILGKSGQKLMPLLSDGANGVNSLRQAAQNLGIVLSDKQIQDADKTADKLAELSVVLNAKISGAVADNVSSINALADALVSLVTGVGDAIKAWKEWKKEVQIRQAENTRDGWFSSDAEKADAQRRIDQLRGAKPKPRVLMEGTGWQSKGFSTGAPAKPGSGPMAQEFMAWKPAKTNFAGGGSAFDFAPGAGIAGGLEAISGGATKSAIAILDTLPAKAKLSAEQIEALTASVQRLGDELFPQEAQLREYQTAMADIGAAAEAGVITPERVAALQQALTDANSNVVSLFANIKFGSDQAITATDVVQANLEEIGSRAVVAGDAMGNSFASAANKIISAVDMIGSSFGGSGGGFFGKLSSVLSLGMKLGEMGLFGEGFQSDIMSMSGARAAGGPVNAGGLYLVGERGPELFAPGRTGQIVPNHALGGQTTVQVVPSPYFNVVVDGRIQSAAPMIATAGAEAGVQKMAYRQSRRVG